MADDSRSGPPSAQTSVGSLLPFQLFGLGRLVEREMDGRLAEHGLSLRTLGVLGHLAAATDISYSDLARRADVTVQAIHTTVRRMVADDLVAAEGVAGQAAALSLTDHGRARMHAAAATLSSYEDELMADSGIDRRHAAEIVLALAASAWRRSPPPST